MLSVASKQYWVKHWQQSGFEIAPLHHPIRVWIESEVPEATHNQSCFEIGCYPGKFLAIFGDKGYQLNGIDLYKNTKDLLPLWLNKNKYSIGKFIEDDFLKYKNINHFDYVCSFGFIEHFQNLDNVIKKHVDITKQNGTIMVDVPNLKSPIYHLLYRIFEPETISNHNLSTLNLDKIKKSFIEHHCYIKTATYSGYFYFRFVTKTNKLSQKIEKIINFFRPIFELFPRSFYQRYIIVSAIKD